MNLASLTRWWQGLSPRERGLVATGALIVVAVVVYALLWEPPATGIRKLRSDLPQLQADAASMRTMADEAARLRGAAGAATPTAPNDRVAAVRRSLERSGLWSAGGAVSTPVAASPSVPMLTVSGTAPSTTVAATSTPRAAPPDVGADGERVRVRFDDVDYGVWVAWLATAETELAARASRVTVASSAPKGPVGHVRAEAWFDWTPSTAAPRS